MARPRPLPYDHLTHSLVQAIRAVAWLQRLMSKDDPTDEDIDAFVDAFGVVESLWELERTWDTSHIRYWDRFRGHYDAIPEAIGAYAEASYHELANRIALDAYARISLQGVRDAAAQRPIDPAGEWDGMPIRCDWDKLRSRLTAIPDFHGNRLVAMIRDEASRALLAHGNEDFASDRTEIDEYLPDGPHEPNLMVWDGQQHVLEIEPKPFRLLCYLWDKRNGKDNKVRVAVYDVARDVWDDRSKKYENMKTAVSRVNNALTGCEIPLLVSKDARDDVIMFEQTTT